MKGAPERSEGGDCPTAQAYEYKRSYPDVPGLVRLADFFNVSLDYLMGRSDVREVQKVTEDDGPQGRISSARDPPSHQQRADHIRPYTH